MYEYKCETIEVIDGNTIDAHLDLGFNVTIRQRIKLYGVNVPSMTSGTEAEREAATQAKNKLIDIIGKEFVCQTLMNKRGKAGRILGKVFAEDKTVDVNQTMIDSGFASHFGE